MVKIPEISLMAERIESIERTTKANHAEISARTLLLEEESRQFREEIESLKKVSRDYKPSVNQLAVDVGCLRDEIKDAKLSRINTDEFKSLSASVEEMRVDITRFKNNTSRTIAELQETFASVCKQWHTPPSACPPPTPAASDDARLECPIINDDRHVSDDRQVFDADILLFMDSNGKHLRADIMKHGAKVEKVWAPTISDAIAIIRSARFVRAPSQVLFHIGTNDLEWKSPDGVIADFRSLIGTTKTILPSPDIFVSELLPRRDLCDELNDANGRLYRLSFQLEINYIRHSLNIDNSMLDDVKHLNMKGFFRLLANIRFYMFGIFKTKNSRNRSSRP